MNILNSSDELYELQEAWNTLDPREALVMDQFDLADRTKYSSAQWSQFLRDGRVAKFIEQETTVFRSAQMRKLIDQAASNDKSVGAAQMLNAMGKLDSDDEAEPTIFIYSHVPLTANECEADTVTVENNWRPPEVIHEVEEKKLDLVKPEAPKEEVKSKPKPKLDEEDWF